MAKRSMVSKRDEQSVKAVSPRTVKKGSGLDVAVLRSSFNALAPKADALVARFYQKLFTDYPGVKPLFSHTDIATQRKKLVSALKLVVANLEKPAVLTNAIKELGARHQQYGAEPAHYEAVATTLLAVMEEFAGKLWTPRVHHAWEAALNTIAETMLGAYGEADDTLLTDASDTNADNDELLRLRASVDGAMTAIMMIDRDLVITYANKSTIKLLQKHEDALRSIYKGFNVDDIIGTCIDTFHAKPEHQRKLLGDPSNLPYSTDIKVGALIFNINVTAQHDAQGEYMGNTLEWSDVTDLRKSETEVARLHGTVDGALTCIMMINRNLVVTYVNQSTMKLLKKNETTLRTIYPGFNADKVLGVCIDIFHAKPEHQRRLLEDPRNLPYSTDIIVGPLIFNINVTAIRDREGTYVGNALEWSDVTGVRAKETEVARLQSAVDGAQTNIMLCDRNLVITYANPAVIAMLSRRQAVLQKVFPGFDSQKLIGVCIDRFHKNPAHQQRVLGNKSGLPAKAEIKIADIEFEVNATAVLDQKGELIGNMVEWRDITEQKDAERQIESLINGAISGILDRRINAESYAGFVKNISVGINKLLDTVVTPVQETTRVMKAMSGGDLNSLMSDNYDGEFKVLSDAINSTVVNLKDIVTKVIEASGSINTASSEISQGNTNLSQRTEEQASSLEETASSMEELTGTVKQNAESARTANQLSLGSRNEAEKGGEVARRTIQAMSEINNASKKIADIIGVIDEIAFQTNLLALNAAVEAARAGEQGRGFAVVASEVRNLAQRSAGAAKEIKALIKDSMTKVEEGSKLVNDTGHSLDEIVGSVKKVSDIIAEIAAASQEQASGIEQVNKTVMQMDEMTQQNAALVEEAASASEALSAQAEGLQTLMEFFKIDERVVARRPAVKSAAKPSKPNVSRKDAGSAPTQQVKNSRSAPKKDESDEDWKEF